MIKDIVVALSLSGDRDVAGEYAVSVAAPFAAHVTGVAFAYEPVIADPAPGGFPLDFIEESRAESRKAAESAAARVEAVARAAGVAAATRITATPMVGR